MCPSEWTESTHRPSVWGKNSASHTPRQLLRLLIIEDLLPSVYNSYLIILFLLFVSLKRGFCELKSQEHSAQDSLSSKSKPLGSLLVGFSDRQASAPSPISLNPAQAASPEEGLIC